MKELEIAKEACKKASEYLLGLTEKIVNINESKDIKLQADIESEKIILDILQKNFNYPILTEEAGEVGVFCTEGKYWIVDPIDGTLNFSKDIPISCISIALYEKDEPILGVVYDFNRNEMFSGVVGIGAWLNDKQMQLSTVAERSKAVIATGFPSYRSYKSGSLQEFISFVQDFKKVRLFGSAALSLAYVACGRCEVYSEEDIKLWDVAAGIAMIKSLGGYVYIQPSGSKYGFDVVCGCNKEVIDEKCY